MKKVLITGMTSAQTREITRDGATTVAGEIADRLRALGLEVDVAPFDVMHIANPIYTDRYDSAVVGLAPVRGLTSAYMYGALAAVQLFGLERTALYHQDVGGRKTLNDLRSIPRNPESLVDPFFHYKRGWFDARRPEVFPLLQESLNRLANNYEDEPFDLEALVTSTSGILEAA